jgi:SPX domain protein involved in polyphosphate accumulation
MAMEVFNRYERKFLIHTDLYQALQKRLSEYVEPDGYNENHEFYTISNLYYDTKDHYLIRNSIEKPIYKEKLRLRGYGIPGREDKVFLEIKKKIAGLVNKRRTKLRLQEAYDFVETGIKPEPKTYMNKQVLKEIEYLLKLYDLEPKLYVAYDRRAFFSKEDKGLRITFDTNIRTRRAELCLEDGDHGDPLLGKDQWLMEIKAQKAMPIWLPKLLSEYKIVNTSFSKYGEEYKKMLASSTDRRKELQIHA